MTSANPVNSMTLKNGLQIKGLSITLSIYVIPNSKKTELVGLHGEALKLKIHAQPIDGKANQEIVEFLSNLLKIKRNQVVITQGQLGNRKLVEISLKSTVELTEVENKILKLVKIQK